MAENTAQPLAEDDIANRLASLSPAQRALLESRLKKKGLTAPTEPVIPRRSENEPVLASYAQQQMWFFDQLAPGSAAFNIVRAARLTGKLHVAALEQSLSEILRRHEALRTTFSAVDGQPTQVIRPPQPFSMPMIDLRELPALERENEAKRLVNEQVQRPVDLSHGPMLRATLLRLGDEEHIFIVIVHHIVSDGWSLGIFTQELQTLYRAFSTGQPSPLPPLSIQYVDFACWQRQLLQGSTLEALLAYWKHQLRDNLSALELPTDHPRPAAQTFRGAHQFWMLDKPITQALKDLSGAKNVTLYMTLLAAFMTLLHRYTGQTNIAVGSPIAGRNWAEIEGLIGLFMNTLVMQVDLSGDPPFTELLERVRRVALEAYAHQSLPFEMLVSALQPRRDPSYHPLYQVEFILQNLPGPSFELPDLAATPIEFESETSKLDVTLELSERSGELCGTLEYNTDLFEASTITRLVDHFQVLLQNIVADPGCRLSDLPILTVAERHQLLIEWNDTRAEYPQDLCIHQLFEAQVKRTPDAIAVQFEDQWLTYHELNRRANQLAHYLQSLGIEPETLVALCMDRSLEMVIGVLGILKSGAAYLPLDPAYPQERLEYMLADSHAQLLLTRQHLADRFSQHEAHVLCLEAEGGSIAQQRDDNPDSKAKPENLVYVIYTSGSTGAPKGVMVPHGSLVNFAWYAGIEYALVPSDRVLQFAALSWDTSGEEIFPCLIRGATLVLRTNAMLTSIPAFLRQCREWAVAIVNLPTAYWHVLTGELATTDLTLPPSLRVVIIGGERALPERLAMWQECAGRDIRLVNTFGLTEATAVSTLCDLTALEKIDSRDVPIGRPIANTCAYLLDSHLQPVPVGVPGTLYIGGKGVSRGYLNRPELTSARFVSDPFRPGERLYNTGDLARWLPDANLEYLGRADNQVKIRGFRIELGEIETALYRHPAVHNVVVVAREDVAGGRRLVAYVVPRAGTAPTLSDLRCFLKESLPEYMLPAASVTLDRLPLTPSGKVDRRALPAPDQVQTELAECFVAPRTPTEKTLANLWAEVLGIKQVGIHDNFFELGGHSLVATRIMSRLYTAFEIDMPLGTLFEASTVASLAQRVEAMKWAAQSTPMLQVPAQSLRDEGEL